MTTDGMKATGMLTGRAWRFGDYVHVMHFLSGKYDPIHDPAQTSKHVLEDSDPTFVQIVRKGDLIVAGKCFGQGKHHANAIQALAYLGIAGFIAETFDSMFHRICINRGIPAFALKGFPSQVLSGDSIEVDLRAGTATNVTRGTMISAEPASKLLLAIIEAGGLEPYTLRRLRGQGAVRISNP